MTTSMLILAAAVTANFDADIGKIRPELHSSGFGPQICSCPQTLIDSVKAMGFKAARTHDWALINPNERVCDYFHIFPLMHLDATDPKNYVFGPTDYLLKRTREETGLDVFYRLGTSIEHSGTKVHFNTLIPEDFDKVAEVFAGTIRHYNRGWANGFNWGIKYWEIWNEPDGHNNMWCLPDGDGERHATTPALQADLKARDQRRRDLFVKFYVTCLKRIKREFPEVKVGGPALCSMKKEYFTALLKACKEAGVAPDFISWHHYTKDPAMIMNAIETGRKLCDDFGFTDCELIINEWHFMGYGFGQLRSTDPEVIRKVWSGPASHNGIDSSCFNLTMLAKFQTSKLDQAYYYGCRPIGSWGYMDEFKRKYKVYYGLKMFGDFVRDHKVICESAADGNGITALAAKSEDGARRSLLVVDYRAKVDEIAVDVKGVAADGEVRGWVHDYARDCEPFATRISGGKITLKKGDANSAAFLLTF